MDKPPALKMSLLQERINLAQNLTKLIPKFPAPVKMLSTPVTYIPTTLNKKPKEPELR